MISLTLPIGGVPFRVTAEIAAVNGLLEVAVKRIDLAGVPMAWALRRKANQTIAQRSPVPCRVNERANLEFTLSVPVTSAEADLEIA